MSPTMTDDLPLAAEFPPDDLSAAMAQSWSTPRSRAPLSTSGWWPRLTTACGIEPLYGRAAEARAVAGRAPGTPWP